MYNNRSTTARFACTTFGALLSFSLAMPFTVCAQSMPAAVPPAPPPTSTAAPTDGERPALQAGAQVVVLTLNDLRSVGLDIKHLTGAAQHLYDEVTIQPVTLNTMPSMIGPGMIINIPIGTTPTGEIMPAKPARVNAAMTELRSEATLMKEDVDAFVNGEKQLAMPGDAREELTPQLREWVKFVNNIFDQFTALESLTKASPYNQPAIANAAYAIVEDGKQLEELRRTIHRVLQREGKREEKLEKQKEKKTKKKW